VWGWKQGLSQILPTQEKEEVAKWAYLRHATIVDGGQNYLNLCDTFHKWCPKVEFLEGFHVTPFVIPDKIMLMARG
jgi:hypothetical protein